MTYTPIYSFIETRLFTRLVGRYLSDTEYAWVQDTLLRDAGSGNLIPGAGGIRKLRWSRKGAGKRGGLRIIYHAMPREGFIWMLTIYAKNEVEDIPAHLLRRIREELDE